MRSGGRSATQGRLLLASLLLVVNAGLVALNLQRQGIWPFSTDDDGSETATADGDGGSTTSTAGPEASPTTGEATTTSVDDWPGGHGPVPAGAPVPRVARLSVDGRMELTGSVPNWETALKIAEFAGSALPGGVDAVDNNLTWHPDASPDPQSGIVVLDPAATFASGSTDIDPSSLPALDLVAGMLKARPTMFAVVIGHTDASGDEELNAQLALDRTSSVVSYLVGQGVIGGQLVVAAASADDPFASNDTVEGRESNRRIEIRFENILVPPLSFG